MALRAAILAALLAGSLLPALPDAPVPPFKPVAPSTVAVNTWIFSGLLDDGREPYSGTLQTGSDATAFEFRLGAGMSCTGGDTTVGPGSVRLSDVPCSDDRKLQASFVPRGEAELTVFGEVGTQRFTASAHRLGTEAPVDEPDDPGARGAAPPVEPPIGPAPSSPRHG